MGKSIVIGIDVGNFDTKSQTTNTPSGFGTYSKPPFGANETLEYNGAYYVPDITRFPYVKDKTINQNAFILTLFGIAKEILSKLRRKNVTEDLLQNEVDNISVVHLGVGLPPTHMSKQSEGLKNYYRENFGEHTTFLYNGINFSFSLGEINVYPQDFAAVITYHPKKQDFITNKYKSYYAIDIGGYTVDVVPIINGQPDVKKCDSKELGILKLFDEVITETEREFGVSLNPERVESVLKNEDTIIPPEVVSYIKEKAEEWVSKILNQLRQNGLEFAAYPVVFIGGGAQLFKSFIKKNPMLTSYAFIPNPNANADGYKKLLELELLKNLKKAKS